MFISGVMTSCATTACEFNDPELWTQKGSAAFLSPNQAWTALYDMLNAPFAPEQQNGQSLNVPNPLSQPQLPYITDVANGAG
jgi:hypothetical protein